MISIFPNGHVATNLPDVSLAPETVLAMVLAFDVTRSEDGSSVAITVAQDFTLEGKWAFASPHEDATQGRLVISNACNDADTAVEIKLGVDLKAPKRATGSAFVQKWSVKHSFTANEMYFNNDATFRLLLSGAFGVRLKKESIDKLIAGIKLAYDRYLQAHEGFLHSVSDDVVYSGGDHLIDPVRDAAVATLAVEQSHVQTVSQGDVNGARALREKRWDVFRARVRSYGNLSYVMPLRDAIATSANALNVAESLLLGSEHNNFTNVLRKALNQSLSGVREISGGGNG